MGLLDSSSDDDSSVENKQPKTSAAQKKKISFLADSDSDADVDDDDSSVSSDGSIDDLEAEKQICHATYGKQLNPTERNPSMQRDDKNAAPASLRQSIINILGGGGDAGGGGNRRQSMFGRPDTVEGHTEGRAKPSLGRRVSTFVKSTFKRKGLHWNSKQLTQECLVMDLKEIHEENLLEDLWFTYDEMKAMKWDADEVADALDAGEEVDNPRGLEAKTKEGNWIAYKMRQDVTNEVLDEQDRQYDLGVAELDDEKFRQVSLEVTQDAQRVAHELALQDEKEALELLQETKAIVDAWRVEAEAAVAEGVKQGAGDGGEVTKEAHGKKRQKSILKTSSMDSNACLDSSRKSVTAEPAKKMQRKSWFVFALNEEIGEEE